MSSLIPFQFETHSIRVVMLDDGPWWVATDVCAAIDIGNTSDALKRLDDDERKSLKNNSIDSNEGVINQALNENQDVNLINEPGLYTLILSSRKPEAKTFKRWITHEVIPSIRKTGSYSIEGAAPAPKLSREERYRLGVYRDAVKTARLIGFEGNMALLSADAYCQNTLGVSVLAGLGATHLLADPRGRTYTPTELGKMCNPPLSAIKLNFELERAGLQKRDMGEWMPTDKATHLCEWLDTGKRHGSGAPVKQVRWFKQVLGHLPSHAT